MTAALRPIGETVPDNAHPVVCPLPGCASPSPVGRMWRDRPHASPPRRRWHSIVTDEPGVMFDGESGYSAAHWVLTSHVINAHDQLATGTQRAAVALACNRAAIDQTRGARGLQPVTLRETAECAECQTGLTLTDEGWRDEHGTDICAATARLCDNLCRPHAEGAHPKCGACHGRGEVYDTHVPYMDTRTSAGTP